MRRSIASPSQRYPHVSSMSPVPISLSSTVDATIGNQAFSHDGCNIHPGLSCNKTNNTFLNSLRKNEVESQVEFTLKIMERDRVTRY